MTFEERKVEELVELYYKAKDAYYNTPKPIMKDSEFDKLETYLLDNDYIDASIGTVEIKGKKAPHITPMLSLDKAQVFTEEFTIENYNDIIKALARYDDSVRTEDSTMLRFSDKVDGLAINAMYYEGVLTLATTRGNGLIGTDITERVRHIVPNKVSKNFSGEVRGEIYLKKSVFLEKYSSDYKNPRNLASGIVASDEKDPRRKDLNIFWFEAKGTETSINNLPEFDAQAIPTRISMNTFAEVKAIYDEMMNLRSSLDYPTDGIVVRIAHATEHRDNGLVPLYSVAVKFPPMLATTRIKSIQWNLKKSGRYVPKAILEPTELDGTIVVHTALHNWRWINDRGCWVGAVVVIGKNGDIIPQIQSVTEKAEPSGIPDRSIICPEGINLIPSGDMSEIINRIKFIEGMLKVGFFGFGEATFDSLYELFEGKAENLFDESLFTKDNLFPVFGKGKKGVDFIRNRKEILNKGITMAQLLHMMQFDACADRHTARLAPFYESFVNDGEVSMDNVDLSGLNSAVVENVTNNHSTIDRVLSAIELYHKNGYKFSINKIRVIKETDITFEMTGSPKFAGYKTKEDFVRYVSTWVHTKLNKETTYLITDDLVSMTSKMKTAKKNGTKVLTYEQATEAFRESLN